MQTGNLIRESNIQSRTIRQWSIHASQCEGLARLGLWSVGHASILDRYEVVRARPDFEHLTFCTAGAGESLIDGQWTPIFPDQVALSPRGAPHGARSVSRRTRGKPWKIYWVVFGKNDGTGPRAGRKETRITVPYATLKPAVTASLEAAIVGLHCELMQGANPLIVHHWCELIHLYVEQILGTHSPDPRMTGAWQAIAANLARPWTVPEMAATAGVSPGHFSRMCRQALGRGPRAQLALLRMNQAETLLQQTNEKIETIAREVGYESAYAFSTACRRITGKSPTELRMTAWPAGR